MSSRASERRVRPKLASALYSFKLWSSGTVDGNSRGERVRELGNIKTGGSTCAHPDRIKQIVKNLN